MKLDRLIAEALQKLREGPDSAYERLKDVVLGGTPVRSIRDVSPDKFPGRSLGRYFPKHRMIAMSGAATDPWRLYVLAHEAGHATTRDERGAWEVGEKLLLRAGIKPDKSWFQRKEKSLRPAGTKPTPQSAPTAEAASRIPTTNTYGKPQYRQGPSHGAQVGQGNIGGARNRGTPGYPVPPEKQLDTDGGGHLETQDEGDEPEHKGTFLGLKVPIEIAEQLAVEGGEAPEDMHVTLFYQKGLSEEQAAEVEEAIRVLEVDGLPGGEVSRTEVFPASDHSDGRDVLVARVDGEGLRTFREMLIDMLDSAGIDTSSDFPDYKPHITLKYLEGGESEEAEVPHLEWEFKEHVFKLGSGAIDETAGRNLQYGGAMAKAPKAIPHIDDLKPEQFARLLQRLSEGKGLEVSEKVDGSARITFGVSEGRIWTQSKNGTRRTGFEQYPDEPRFRALRAVHEALERATPAIAKAWPKGIESMTAEVLHGWIPNVIEYGPNALIVHGVQGLLGEARQGVMEVLRATEGELPGGWRFEAKRTIDPAALRCDLREERRALAGLMPLLQARPKDHLYKEQFKQIQEEVREKLLVKLREQRSAYGPEGGDIEGLVFRDLDTGEMTKLVDRDVFTRLNRFLWHFREMIERGSKDDAGEWQKGVMQGFQEVVAKQVLGDPVAATPGFVKYLARNFGDRASGKSPEQRADQTLARYVQDKGLMSGDFAKSFQRSLMGAFKDLARLKAEWEQFKSKPQSVELGGGKVREFPPEHIERTDEAFQAAEASLAGVRAGMEAASKIQHPLTQKVALLKLFMGHRFEKLAAELGGDNGRHSQVAKEQVKEGVFDSQAQKGAPSPWKTDKAVTPSGLPKDSWAEKRDKPAAGPSIYASQFADKLAKRGIRPGAYLGEGAFGAAWDIGGGKVLKITSDLDEAKASNFLKGKQLKHVAQIFDVFRFPRAVPPAGADADDYDTQGNAPYKQDYYGIVLERLAHKEDRAFDSALLEVIDRAGEVFKLRPDQVLKDPKFSWSMIMLAAYKSAKAENYVVARNMQGYMRLMQERQIGEIRDELLRNGVKFADLHSGNLGQKADGTWAAFDLGSESVSPGAEPNVLERIQRLGEGGPIDRMTGPTDLGGEKIGPDDPECLESVVHAQVARMVAEASQRGTIGATIGRFQPFHAGHAALVRRLAGQFDSVLVFVAGQRQDQKNPFSHKLRLRMMELSLPDVWNKVKVFPATIQGKGTGYVPGLVANASASGQAGIGEGGAVTVLVGEDRLADIQKQAENNRKHRGEPGFFDGALEVVALPGVKNDDDAGRISGTKLREALARGDQEAVRGMLDSRLAQSAEFEAVYGRLRDEMRSAGLVQEIAEAVINELGGGAAETGPGATRGGSFGTSGWSRAALAKDMTGDELFQQMSRSPSTRMLPLDHSGTPNVNLPGTDSLDQRDEQEQDQNQPTDLKDCITRAIEKMLR